MNEKIVFLYTSFLTKCIFLFDIFFTKNRANKNYFLIFATKFGCCEESICLYLADACHYSSGERSSYAKSESFEYGFTTIIVTVTSKVL